MSDQTGKAGRTPSPDPEQHPGYCFPSMDDTCGNCHRCTPAAEGRVPTVEWGYRLGDDPYVVVMSGEAVVRQFIEGNPDAAVVRRVIGEWEAVDV